MTKISKLTQMSKAPRIDDEDFDDAMDIFLGEIPVLGTELNVLIDQINAVTTQISTDAATIAASREAVEQILLAKGATVYPDGAPFNYPDLTIARDGNTYRCLGTDIHDDPLENQAVWKQLSGKSEENLVPNARFSSNSGATVENGVISYIDTNTKAPDGMAKSSNVKLEIAAGTLTMFGGTAGSRQSRWPANTSALASEYAGQTLTFKAAVTTAVPHHGALFMTDSGGTTLSKYHTGGGGTEILKVTRTIPTDTSLFYYGFYAIQAGQDVSFEEPVLVTAHDVATDYFVPKRGEIVSFGTKLSVLTGTVSTNQQLALPTILEGRIPNYIKAVHAVVEGTCSVDGSQISLGANAEVPLYSIAGKKMVAAGRAPVVGGVLDVSRDDTWTGVNVYIVAMEV